MLNKLYYVFGVDTGCFYNDDEFKLDLQLNSLRGLRTYIKKQTNTTNDTKAEIKIINQQIKDYKNKLKQTLADNVDTVRTARYDRFFDRDGEPALSRRVSIFDSVLTRTFGLKEREFNDEIMIIKVFYFDIAQSIIKHGFYFNNEKYVFFSSSAGQIRTKKLVAVKEDLLNKYWNLLTAGLTVENINNKGGMTITKFIAYTALCNSATDEWKDFDIDRCIVVDDFENTINGYVDYIDNQTYEITRIKKDLQMTQIDGCGMILPELSSKNFMVRLPWIKGLLAVFDFRKFIETHNASPVITDLFGKEHDIVAEDIKIIFTKSQFKMWKFYNSWQEYKDKFKQYHSQAAICNLEEDEFPDAVINYQMIQTLFDLSDDEIKSLGSKNESTIKSLAKNPDTMLRVFGAVPWNKHKTGFQKCLEVYPELLGDTYSRQTLKEIKNKLEKDLWSARFDIDGKYTFVVPDLYAFCEWLFLHQDNPQGLLKDGEVCCKLFENGEKLDCLRSPHLYIEHPIRVNKTDIEWFTTKAIYVSCQDLISRIVMNDWDGDKYLVTNNKTLINAAERANKNNNVVSLFYEMGKAKAEIINGDSLYKGLSLAFTGGNIGAPSNDITKIWNSDTVTQDAINSVKWLVMEVNQTIDYAKTLFKTEPPQEVANIINQYTKAKVPWFFQYAKKKTAKQVELPNNSPVNRIEKIFPSQKLNYNFSESNLGNFDYHMLLKNPNIKENKELIKKFKFVIGRMKFNDYSLRDKFTDDDNRTTNYKAVYHTCRDEILNYGRSLGLTDEESIDIITYKLFSTNSISKKAYWMMFGDDVYETLSNNLTSNLYYCKRCGKRFYSVSKEDFCNKCTKTLNKKQVYYIRCDKCGNGYEFKRNSPVKIQTCPSCAKRNVSRKKDIMT